MSAPIPAEFQQRYEHLKTFSPMDVAWTDIRVPEWIALIERIAALEERVDQLEWKPIMPDTVLTREHEVTGLSHSGDYFYLGAVAWLCWRESGILDKHGLHPFPSHQASQARLVQNLE
jgi:hypothetical protein